MKLAVRYSTLTFRVSTRHHRTGTAGCRFHEDGSGEIGCGSVLQAYAECSYGARHSTPPPTTSTSGDRFTTAGGPGRSAARAASVRRSSHTVRR